MNISRGNKFYLILLHQLGYKDVQMEKQIKNGLLQCDLYVGDLDLIIDVHGPCHYKNESDIPIDSALYI